MKPETKKKIWKRTLMVGVGIAVYAIVKASFGGPETESFLNQCVSDITVNELLMMMIVVGILTSN